VSATLTIGTQTKSETDTSTVSAELSIGIGSEALTSWIYEPADDSSTWSTE
jgi:hypothetical protein